MQETLVFDELNSLEKFTFHVVGYMVIRSGVAHLVCESGERLPVFPLPKNKIKKQLLWNLLPNINSTGIISNVRVLSTRTLESWQGNDAECVLVGKVLQVSKRLSLVVFEVSLPEGKLLKITLANPDPRMKAEQIWSVTADLEENKLTIVEAVPITPIEKEAEPQPQPVVETAARVELALPKPTAPTQKAIDALEQETGMIDWSLSQPVLRNHAWEWSAVSTQTGSKARVAINGSSQVVHQFSTSTTPAELLVDTDRLAVTALGAARGIGASCFQVEIGPYEVVLDCGTRPKGSKPLPALEYLKNPNLLLVSHSHQDHIGSLPVFHALFPTARMICTSGTREIAHVMLTDCLKVQQVNEDSEPLFDELSLDRALFCLETEPMGEEFEPLPGLKVRFINAGHIVGAACIYLQYGDRSLLYTGDYNTASTRTTIGLQLSDLPYADILITESTYGDKMHPARKNQEASLLTAIANVVLRGGNVLIPAFALGRAQEIILALRTNAMFKKLDVPIYVDGLVRAVTDTFRENLDLLPSAVQNMVKISSTEPFYDEKSKPVVIPISKPLERPLAMAKPSVIIASSGMLNGGASVYYAKTLLERDNAAIFISGYTDEEAPGRKIQALQTGDEIELDGQKLTVRAQIQRFNLSAHADKTGLGQVIGKVNPKHLILVHGSLGALHELARAGDLQDKHFLHIPKVGDTIEFNVAPKNIDASRLARIDAPQEFEVEVVAEAEGAWIRIPESVVESDPRWQKLAANGVIKAKWSGVGLKLYSAGTWDLAVEKEYLDAVSEQECCFKCQFFDRSSGCCSCSDSPLALRMVDPGGYCLEYATQSNTHSNGL